AVRVGVRVEVAVPVGVRVTVALGDRVAVWVGVGVSVLCGRRATPPLLALDGAMVDPQIGQGQSRRSAAAGQPKATRSAPARMTRRATRRTATNLFTRHLESPVGRPGGVAGPNHPAGPPLPPALGRRG